MSGDFETLEINQPKITYLKPEDNTQWLDELINNIEDMKNKISKDSFKSNKKGGENPNPTKDYIPKTRRQYKMVRQIN